MTFWGAEVQPGQWIPFTLPPGTSKLRLSRACMGIDAKRAAKSGLLVKVGKGQPLLVCCLKEGSAPSVGLDLFFNTSCEWTVEGTAPVHITGYLIGDGSSDGEDSGEDDEVGKERQAAVDEIMARKESYMQKKRKAQGEAEGEPGAKKISTKTGGFQVETVEKEEKSQNGQSKSVIMVVDGKRKKNSSKVPKVVLMCEFQAGGSGGGNNASMGNDSAEKPAKDDAGVVSNVSMGEKISAASGHEYDWKQHVKSYDSNGGGGGDGEKSAEDQKDCNVEGAQDKQNDSTTGGGGGGGGSANFCLYIG